MELTKKDRLFLINQYRILASLNKDEKSHYEELIEILENGYEIFYGMVDDWVCDKMPSEEGKFVLNILDFYRTIEDLKRSTKDERLIKHRYGIFRGFDGNSETEYMAFARFLIADQRKFSEQQQYLRQNDNLNSHMPMYERYKSILAKTAEYGQVWDITLEQALDILDT